MVADDQEAYLYIGVEEEGIYRIQAEADADSMMHHLPGSDSLNPNIKYDVEGLALFSYENKKYLIASSQGNFSYALFMLEGKGSYLSSFIIEEGTVDGAEETDGIDLVVRDFGDRFNQGLLVVQDGFNTDGNLARSQNFKYVSFSLIADILKHR
jgi:3-phytase